MAPQHLPVVVNCSINIVNLSGTDIGSTTANVSCSRVAIAIAALAGVRLAN